MKHRSSNSPWQEKGNGKYNVIRFVFLRTTLDAVWPGTGSRGWRQVEQMQVGPMEARVGLKEGGGDLCLGGDSGDGLDAGMREMKVPRMTTQLGLEQDLGQF